MTAPDPATLAEFTRANDLARQAYHDPGYCHRLGAPNKGTCDEHREEA